MSRQRIFAQFEDSGDARFLGMIPVSAVATTEHETIVVVAIERYSDRSNISVHLQLGPDHPEHEWRRKGRSGFPHVIIDCKDDVDTEYAVMPGGSGGGKFSFDFKMQVVPSIPDTAKIFEIAIVEVSWEGPQSSFMSNERPKNDPPPRWRIELDLSSQIGPRQLPDNV